MLYLGSTFEVPGEVFLLCELFVCKMYGSQTCSHVNNLRYELFSAKALQSNQLLPTEDTLIKHTDGKLPSSHAFDSMLSLQSQLSLSPAENGWLECGSSVRVDWMHKQPVPE